MLASFCTAAYLRGQGTRCVQLAAQHRNLLLSVIQGALELALLTCEGQRLLHWDMTNGFEWGCVTAGTPRQPIWNQVSRQGSQYGTEPDTCRAAHAAGTPTCAVVA